MSVEDIDYQRFIDFEDCKNVDEARQRFSQLTNLLNRILTIKVTSKFQILEECALYQGMHKLSWDNKRVHLLVESGRSESVVEMLRNNSWAEKAYAEVKNKKDQVLEDLMALKKILDNVPN